MPVNHFIPAQGTDVAEAPTLVAFHGTGGTERDFQFMHRELGGRFNVLLPRGTVNEMGAWRFFKRLGMGIFDVEDLKANAQVWNDAIREAAVTHGFGLTNLYGMGYSNGANILSGMLLSPNALEWKKLAFLHPMKPYEPSVYPAIHETQILVTYGTPDPTVNESQGAEMVEFFNRLQPKTQLNGYNQGHSISQKEITDVIHFIG